MERMKALVQYAPYDSRYEEVEKPTAGPGEIVLKVKGCGICAGDLKAYHGGIRIWGTCEEDRYIEAPVTGGHEFFGEVTQIGEGVDSCEIGDLLLWSRSFPAGNAVSAGKESIGCVKAPLYTVLNSMPQEALPNT